MSVSEKHDEFEYKKDALFEKYEQLAQERRNAVNQFQSEFNGYETDVKDDGNAITVRLLNDMFSEELNKPELALELAEQALEDINSFSNIAFNALNSVANMTMNLQLAFDTLSFEVIATPIRELEKPLETEGKRPLEIAKDGLQSIKDAGQKLRDNAITALSDACLLEKQATKAVNQASLVLAIRREHLLDFRRRNVGINWSVLKNRVRGRGKEIGKDDLNDQLWVTIEDILEIFSAETEDLIQYRRFGRLISFIWSIVGRRVINRKRNDTDQVLELVALLKKETKLIDDLSNIFDQTNDAIDVIRSSAQEGFQKHGTQ